MTATATKPKASTTTLTIPRLELKAAVEAASKAVGRGPKPVLQNVRIGDGLVTGTDLEVRIDVAIGQMCEPFLVPADRLVSILRSATGDEVKLIAKDTTVKVKCAGGEWTLPTEDVAEFPMWGDDELPNMPSLPEDQFKNAVLSVVCACDAKATSYALGGVLIEATENDVYFVATDGRRMAICVCRHDFATDVFAAKPKAGEKKAPIVPAKVIGTLAAHCGPEGEESVSLAAGDAIFRATVGDITITSRLPSGEFCKWSDVMALGKLKRTDAAKVYTQSFANAISAAAIVTSEQSKGVQLTWGEDKVTVLAKSSEYGESKVECPIEENGTAACIKVNPEFVQQYLKALNGAGEVDVYVTDRMYIGCDWDSDHERYAYCYVLMGMAD